MSLLRVKLSTHNRRRNLSEVESALKSQALDQPLFSESWKERAAGKCGGMGMIQARTI